MAERREPDAFQSAEAVGTGFTVAVISMLAMAMLVGTLTELAPIVSNLGCSLVVTPALLAVCALCRRYGLAPQRLLGLTMASPLALAVIHRHLDPQLLGWSWSVAVAFGLAMLAERRSGRGNARPHATGAPSDVAATDRQRGGSRAVGDFARTGAGHPSRSCGDGRVCGGRGQRVLGLSAEHVPVGDAGSDRDHRDESGHSRGRVPASRDHLLFDRALHDLDVAFGDRSAADGRTARGERPAPRGEPDWAARTPRLQASPTGRIDL